MNRYPWILFSLIALIQGCSTLSSLLSFTKLPALNEKDTYRHELQVDVNGMRVNGVGVAPRSDKYKFRVYPPGNVDRIMWRTCNREEVIDKPDIKSSSWFGGYNYVDFEITPAFGLEDINSCALHIEVLEERKRRNGFAFIEFKDKRPEVSLFSDLICNGHFTQQQGVGVCQSAAGLYQQISFPSPAIQKGSTPECNVMKPLNGDEKIYRFEMPPGECTYYFVSNSRAGNGKRIVFRLSTLGYTDVPPIK